MDLTLPNDPADAVAATAPTAAASDLADAIAARRTFAIISHPDAGKTTLTEKLLLYGNAIHLAGSVRARRSQRHATSDWMAMERERGISITSTVLQFPYQGRIVNLLDTPGHEDFSEDTYRTLAAVDSAVMVLDAAKGIEAQTRKLFEVTKRRGLPLFSSSSSVWPTSAGSSGSSSPRKTLASCVAKFRPCSYRWTSSRSR